MTLLTFAAPLVRALQWALVALLFAVVVVACSTSDDEGETPTSTPQPSATSAPAELTVPPIATTGVPATIELTDANAQIVTDGICQVLVPDGWVDDGTGRGTTSGGHRFVLFGGRLTTSTSWATAINVVATPASGRTISSVEKTDDSILALFADDRGFEYRERFDSIYCDLTVSSVSRPISPDERAYWDAVIESIEPVPSE